MKLILISCLLLLIAATALTTALPQRDRTSYNYTPPQTQLPLRENEAKVTKASNAAAMTSANSANAEASSVSFGPQGYTYRSVRRLKYRQRKRRDVAHLPLNYLLPSNSYLPPISDDTEILNSVVPYVNIEYLPPAVKDVNNEGATGENELQTEGPAVQVEQEGYSPNEEGDFLQDSAVLMDDGYHYKKPAEPMLLPKTFENAYLPPIWQDLHT